MVIDALHMVWDNALDSHRIALVLLVHYVVWDDWCESQTTDDRFWIWSVFPNRQCESGLTDF